jgi:hypothetical protein
MRYQNHPKIRIFLLSAHIIFLAITNLYASSNDCAEIVKSFLLKDSDIQKVDHQEFKNYIQSENLSIIENYKKWEETHGPEELISDEILFDHIMKARLNNTRDGQIISGMHTFDGMIAFLKSRPDLIPHKVIRKEMNIKTPKYCKKNECYEYSIFVSINGVIRLKLPKNAFNSRGRASSISAAKSEQSLYLAKTIFPISMGEKEIRASIFHVMNNATKTETSERLTFYEGVAFDRVRTIVVYNHIEKRIVTAYPSFLKQGAGLIPFDELETKTNFPHLVTNKMLTLISEEEGEVNEEVVKLFKKTLIQNFNLVGYISDIKMANIVLSPRNNESFGWRDDFRRPLFYTFLMKNIEDLYIIANQMSSREQLQSSPIYNDLIHPFFNKMIEKFEYGMIKDLDNISLENSGDIFFNDQMTIEYRKLWKDLEKELAKK